MKSLKSTGHYKWLTRFQTPGNRRKMTFSFWAKVPASMNPFVVSTIDNYDLMIQAGFVFVSMDGSGSVIGGPLPYGEWGHAVVQIDTAQADEANRVKIFVDGEDVTLGDWSSYPDQNHDTGWGLDEAQEDIAEIPTNPEVYKIDELIKVDGSVVAPSAFSSPGSLNFGSDGYWMKFDDFSTIGDDSSGNGHDFTNYGYSSGDLTTDVP